jgi:hypothetical protein
MADANQNIDIGRLWTTLITTVVQRIELLRDIQAVEGKTGSVQRQTGREMMLWTLMGLKLFGSYIPNVGSSGSRDSGRGGKDLIDRLFEKDLERFLRTPR